MPYDQYPPEGLGAPAPGLEALEQAAGSPAIFQGEVIKCTDAHALVVGLEEARGIIPKAEAGLGAEDGRLRDIAIISRVGKPVCFTVLKRMENGDFLLSRRAAQQAALDCRMAALQPGDVLPARVTHLEGFGVFVDIGCGLTSFVGVENISVSRIPHPSHRFAPGQDIFAAVLEKDRAAGRVTLTHRELLGTWMENADRFRAGDTVQGVVRSVESYGVFVELSPNLSGLAELRPGFAAGDRVSVYVKSLLPRRMKVKLALVDRLADAPPRLIGPQDYFIRAGRLDVWRYSPDVCGRVVGRVFGA